MNVNWRLWEYISVDNWIDIGISVGIILLFLLFSKIFTKYIFFFLVKLFNKEKTELFKQILEAYEKPLRWLFIIIGIYIAVDYFPYFEQDHSLFEHLIKSSIIILIAWGLYNLSSTSSILFMKLNDGVGLEVDQIIIPFVSRGLRFVIIAITISVILIEFDYDVTGFIAGLGLGGLAFALAAQDALKNLFGGVVIIAEKPFTLGDWIKTSSVEGTVEDINFRSTIVRTFAQALVTVPNSTLANEAITNWSKMGKRRITFNLGVEYKTPKHKLEKVVKRIEELLRNHDEIHQETIFVNFDEYNNSSLDILLYFFTKTTAWGEYLEVKQDINFKIMEILEEENVSVAFPSRTIYMDQDHQEVVEVNEETHD
ncbi:mechanosensitive ion channel family protein [Tenuibacillus multivorans]|uniref:MscS family membrane protein n=1 Tax=Tenuibacillus multivorans TaxID=237069 RepID=A0A1H0AKJ2_9BACI|nr:mechanosensitive ion channel family protein [Tenuibacillus multivorans]GEL78181.1 putative MscS family protein YhdY [Tenuibacillus multivorans]SDN33861.1 MscS family membrane protein [Tenuibacillus multivorans]